MQGKDDGTTVYGTRVLIVLSSAEMANVEVERAAYLKLMLHTAKYPWAEVSGFLLGQASGEDVSFRQWIIVHRAVGDAVYHPLRNAFLDLDFPTISKSLHHRRMIFATKASNSRSIDIIVTFTAGRCAVVAYKKPWVSPVKNCTTRACRQ